MKKLMKEPVCTLFWLAKPLGKKRCYRKMSIEFYKGMSNIA
mgnify:CR=1 FL=1